MRAAFWELREIRLRLLFYAELCKAERIKSLPGRIVLRQNPTAAEGIMSRKNPAAGENPFGGILSCIWKQTILPALL